MPATKKSFSMPFAIGDDLLYLVPDLFYVEEFDGESSFMTHIGDFFQPHKFDRYFKEGVNPELTEDLGNTLFVNRVLNKEGRKHTIVWYPDSKQTLIVYDGAPLAYKRYPEVGVFVPNVVVDNQVVYWEGITRDHPIGDLLLKQLFTGKYREHRKEILSYILGEVTKDPELKTSLLGILSDDFIRETHNAFPQFSENSTLEDYIKRNLARF